MNDSLRVYCDPLGTFVDLPVKPKRIVSLVSGLTEAFVHMGYSDSIAGISLWCTNFVPDLKVPIIGDYLSVNEKDLRAVDTDFVSDHHWCSARAGTQAFETRYSCLCVAFAQQPAWDFGKRDGAWRIGG